MTEPEGQVLLKLARETIAESLGGPKVEQPGDAFLKAPGAVFVTLRDPSGELRGCIGSILAHRPLLEDVQHNAIAAASQDPRVMPVRADELPGLRIEVSVLSALEPLEVTSEEDALRKIRPGVDGIELSAMGRRAVFIPKMWDQLADTREFLRYLRMKAGLPKGWADGTKLRRFTAETFGDPEAMA
ncbi:MAG: AmmeMemoRadiSam system protein A [Myxococcaceae bacterium]